VGHCYAEGVRAMRILLQRLSSGADRQPTALLARADEVIE
jgi:hypothetical protein